MDVPVLVDQQELIYISCAWTQDVVWKTCQEQWIIETYGERERERERERQSGKSALSARLDDGDGILYNQNGYY